MNENEFTDRLTFINQKRNINRGFRKLIVWQDSLKLYSIITELQETKKNICYKSLNNIIDAAHSISRNIAEGYGRKSIQEYLRFLDFAIGKFILGIARGIWQIRFLRKILLELIPCIINWRMH
jgi:hypothetical protein